MRALEFRFMHRAAVLRRLIAFVQAVVTHHARHPQPVVLEDPRAALGLRTAMLDRVAPGFHRSLVAEENRFILAEERTFLRKVEL